ARQHEEHELARPHGDASLLEQAEQRSLGVHLLDQLAGGADGRLHDRRVLVDRSREVDVLLAPGQFEDVSQLLLALVDAADEPDPEEREPGPDEDHGHDLAGGHRSRSRSATSRAVGTRTLRALPAEALWRDPGAVPVGARNTDAGTSTLFSASLSRNFGRSPVATSSPLPSGVGRWVKMSWSRMTSPSMPCTSVTALM